MPKKGFAILEIVVAVSIVSLALFGLSQAARVSLVVMNETTKRIQASFLLEEGIEAVKSMRDQSWQADINPLTAGTYYFLSFSNNRWHTGVQNVFVDKLFERKFHLANVYRDSNDNIAGSGTLDAGTKLLTVSVAWRGHAGTTTQSISTYIANIFSN